MSRKKKNGNQDTLQKVLMITATLNLIRALIELVNKLIE